MAVALKLFLSEKGNFFKRQIWKRRRLFIMEKCPSGQGTGFPI